MLQQVVAHSRSKTWLQNGDQVMAELGRVVLKTALAGVGGAAKVGVTAISGVTGSEVQTVLANIAARILPSGGTTGQALTKSSNTDYAVGWTTVSGGGGGEVAPVTITTNTTAATDKHTYLVDASGGAVTLTLPTAVGRAGKVYAVKKIDSSVNTVTIDGATTETIDGALTIDTALQWDVVAIESDGANWQTVTPPTGASSSSGEPSTTVEVFDDFVSGQSTSGQIGSLGWSSGNGVIAGTTPEAGRPGIVNKTTSATSGTQSTLRLLGVGSSSETLQYAETFDMIYSFRLNTNDANTQMHIGICSTANIIETNGIYLEKLAADTSWFAVCESGNTQSTRVNMGAVSTNWVKLRIRRIDASTIGFTLDGGTEQTITTQIPTGPGFVQILIANTAAANKNFDLDYFWMRVTGLSR